MNKLKLILIATLLATVVIIVLTLYVSNKKLTSEMNRISNENKVLTEQVNSINSKVESINYDIKQKISDFEKINPELNELNSKLQLLKHNNGSLNSQLELLEKKYNNSKESINNAPQTQSDLCRNRAAIGYPCSQ